MLLPLWLNFVSLRVGELLLGAQDLPRGHREGTVRSKIADVSGCTQETEGHFCIRKSCSA